MRFITLCVALLIAMPALAVNLLGTEATFGWTQPAGIQPDRWIVWVSRNGGDVVSEQTVTEMQATVVGVVGETITVTVQAALGDEYSAMSVVSNPVTFQLLQAPTGVQIRCPEGQAFTEVGGGWWSCQ